MLLAELTPKWSHARGGRQAAAIEQARASARLEGLELDSAAGADRAVRGGRLDE
jgi:hypothetical protein